MPYFHYFSQRNCSHCNAIAEQQVLHSAPEVTMHQRGNGQARWVPSNKLFRCLVSCAHCRQASLYVIEMKPNAQPPTFTSSSSPLPYATDGFLNRLYVTEARNRASSHPDHRTLAIKGEQYGTELSALFNIVHTYPNGTLQRPEADYLPDEVNEAFDELASVMTAPRYSAIACRRILEIATSEKLDDPKERLADRIGQLQGSGFITKEIAEWAKSLKDILNASTHGGTPPSETEAKELISLTNLIVDLLYIYPAKIDKLRVK